LTNRLREHALVVDDAHGFAYFDRRDLLGLVDGTENPAGTVATAAVPAITRTSALPVAVT
jgi:putative iron-dependent peroxidase